MTQAQKRTFVRNITKSVRDHVIGLVGHMPEEWDGHELRQYLADEFAWEVYYDVMKGRRLKEYRSMRAQMPR